MIIQSLPVSEYIFIYACTIYNQNKCLKQTLLIQSPFFLDMLSRYSMTKHMTFYSINQFNLILSVHKSGGFGHRVRGLNTLSLSFSMIFLKYTGTLC